jgi:hypothetical protein
MVRCYNRMALLSAGVQGSVEYDGRLVEDLMVQLELGLRELGLWNTWNHVLGSWIPLVGAKQSQQHSLLRPRRNVGGPLLIDFKPQLDAGVLLLGGSYLRLCFSAPDKRREAQNSKH